jgi:CelD/BcsL family acetyltransferase involved in cellulose biosynthesis
MTRTFAVIADGHELASYQGEWRDLLARSASNEPTLSPAWLVPWWHVYGKMGGRRLRALLFWEDGRLCGLAPLLRRVHRYYGSLPFRRLEWMASGEPEAEETCSDYLGVIAARGSETWIADAFAEAVAGDELGGWDELVLPSMDGQAAMPGLLRDALCARGVKAELIPAGAAPYIPLPATWADYLRALPGTHRARLNRSLRDFESWAGGPAELVVARTPEQLAYGQRLLYDLHGARWSGGVFAHPRFRAFHERVMHELHAEGALELAWLQVRAAPVAVIYNLVWNGKVYFYQSGRRTDLPRGVRPGIALHAHSIQAAIAAGRREYDFLAGTSRYKTQLALGERPLVRLRAARTRMREPMRAWLDRLRAQAGAWRRRTINQP